MIQIAVRTESRPSHSNVSTTSVHSLCLSHDAINRIVSDTNFSTWWSKCHWRLQPAGPDLRWLTSHRRPCIRSLCMHVVEQFASTTDCKVYLGSLKIIATRQCIKISPLPNVGLHFGSSTFRIFVVWLFDSEHNQRVQLVFNTYVMSLLDCHICLLESYIKGGKTSILLQKSWSYLTQPIHSDFQTLKFFHYAIINNPDALCSSPCSFGVG